MANMLDNVLSPSKMATPAPTKICKDKAEELEKTINESIAPDCAKAGPSECRPIEQVSESLPEKISLPKLEAAYLGDLGYIVRHASGKQLSGEQIAEVQYYAKDLKYPQGSLVYGGNDENYYIYCLPDNKEIDVCREMMDKMGYPKLELGLSAMPKDHIADCLAYNNLKVCIFNFCNFFSFRLINFVECFTIVLIIIFYFMVIIIRVLLLARL
jgi:hypothetical protein